MKVALILLCSTLACGAANHYVLIGASGSGASWSDAYGDFPGTLTRGDTYYVGIGSYGSETFNTAASGSNLITVKKATVADHGTATGWSDAYAGVATFGPWTVSTAFWDFEGQYRGSDWSSGYGIVIVGSDTASYSIVNLSSVSSSNITMRYIEVRGPGLVTSNFGEGVHATGGHVGNAQGVDNVTIEYCYFDGIWCDQFNITGNNWVWRFNFFDQNRDQNNCHAQNIQDNGGNTRTFAFNKIRNPDGTAVYTCIGWGQTNTDYQIYGNLIWDTPAYFSGAQVGASAFFEAIQTAQINNVGVYNNTFYSVKWRPIILHVDNTGSNRFAYNNLWSSCSSIAGATLNFIQDYSYFANTTHDAETHEQTGLDLFRSTAAFDFHVTVNTSSGLSLGSPFDIDFDGAARASRSRGAYEYQPSTFLGAGTFGSWTNR